MNRNNILKWLEADTHYIPHETVNLAVHGDGNNNDDDGDDDVDEVFAIGECIYCSNEDYQKKIWKKLSERKTMDNLREIFENDEGCNNDCLNKIQEYLKKICEDETKSYEEIIIQLGGLNASEVSEDDLETLLQKAAKNIKGLLSQENKDALFAKFDKQVSKDFAEMKEN
ncbi:hypothetical protein C0J52_08378 [Blattella germanica]|nr:hypothetical protein C0J52_08378 [Blattella germanica]